MKKYFIITGILLIGACIAGWYYYQVEHHKALVKMVKPFFDEAQKQLLIVIDDIAKLERAGVTEKPKIPPKIVHEATETGSIPYAKHEPDPLGDLKQQLLSLQIIDIIARRDIDQLKRTPTEELQRYISISVSSDVVKDVPTDQGTITSAQLAGENTLAILFFHSALDQTTQDKDATLAMLQVLFDKKLDPHAKGAVVYWVQPHGQEGSYDYVQLFSLPEIAGFRTAANMLREYQRTFTVDKSA